MSDLPIKNNSSKYLRSLNSSTSQASKLDKRQRNGKYKSLLRCLNDACPIPTYPRRYEFDKGYCFRCVQYAGRHEGKYPETFGHTTKKANKARKAITTSKTTHPEAALDGPESISEIQSQESIKASVGRSRKPQQQPTRTPSTRKAAIVARTSFRNSPRSKRKTEERASEISSQILSGGTIVDSASAGSSSVTGGLQTDRNSSKRAKTVAAQAAPSTEVPDFTLADQKSDASGPQNNQMFSLSLAIDPQDASLATADPLRNWEDPLFQLHPGSPTSLQPTALILPHSSLAFDSLTADYSFPAPLSPSSPLRSSMAGKDLAFDPFVELS